MTKIIRGLPDFAVQCAADCNYSFAIQYLVATVCLEQGAIANDHL